MHAIVSVACADIGKQRIIAAAAAVKAFRKIDFLIGSFLMYISFLSGFVYFLLCAGNIYNYTKEL